MQNRKVWLISIGCGLACAISVALYMASVQGQVQQARTEALDRYGGDQLEVCVAKRDIVAGETITESDIEMKLWVAALLPEESISDKNQAIGSMASSTIMSGEVISQRRLGSSDDQLEVPAGFTAVSVPAKNVQAVGGALSPGSKVDLYSTGDTSTTKIGSDLLVLATSSSSSESKTEISWITLAVGPEAVEELVSAAERATLYFALPGEELTPDTNQNDNSANSQKTKSSSDTATNENTTKNTTTSNSGSSRIQ